MGRRSINTTKSGKYMNPTDQARKEARKKELKKNKRQRQMVRAAVLKMKDPHQILEELEKIDEMEYNVLQPSPLNEKVLKEKRKKLRETFERVLKMYDKDEPEKWLDLKRKEVDYDKKRAHLVSYYESVKHAQSVQIDEIPLPTLQVPDTVLHSATPEQIPLPADPKIPKTKPILKKDTAYKEIAPGTEPPGVPMGPPPNLKEILADLNKALDEKENQLEEAIMRKKRKKEIKFSDDVKDDDIVPPGEEPEEFKKPGPQPTSLQRRMLALSGQNIDEFMKEMEEVHRKRERDKAADLSARLAALPQPPQPPQISAMRQEDSDSEDEDVQMPLAPPPMSAIRMPPPLSLNGPLPPGLPPMPPPLPPGMLPPPPPMNLGMRPPRPPPRLPPRPPLLMPPSLGPPGSLHPLPLPGSGGVLTAAPQIKKSATISAAPQILNLSKEVTRFVPSSLRIKRDDKSRMLSNKMNKEKLMREEKKNVEPTKDDALEQFMKEMQHLL